MEQWIHGALGHEVFNPNRESELFLAKSYPNGNFRELKKSDVGKYTALVRKLIDLDSHEIAERSDYVVCLWDSSAQRGAGTTGEVTMARFTAKPLYLVTSMDLEEIPGWILGCSTDVFSSFDELKTFLQSKYGQKCESTS